MLTAIGALAQQGSAEMHRSHFRPGCVRVPVCLCCAMRAAVCRSMLHTSGRTDGMVRELWAQRPTDQVKGDRQMTRMGARSRV